jgi:hypothetical protein
VTYIDCGIEVIDLYAWERDGYRIPSAAANARTAGEPRWVATRCWRRGDECAFDILSDPATLAEALSQAELAELIDRAENSADYAEREAIIDSLGPLLRKQVRAASAA